MKQAAGPGALPIAPADVLAAANAVTKLRTHAEEHDDDEIEALLAGYDRRGVVEEAAQNYVMAGLCGDPDTSVELAELIRVARTDGPRSPTLVVSPGGELERLRARVAELEAEEKRLGSFQDAAHGLICNAHHKGVDYVTEEDASPGWAQAARAWIDAYPFGVNPWPRQDVSGQVSS